MTKGSSFHPAVLPQHSGKLLWKTLSHQPNSNVVQSQRTHRPELITKRSCRSTCLSPCPHLALLLKYNLPHCEKMAVAHRLCSLPTETYSRYCSYLHFYQSFLLMGREGNYYANTWILASADADWPTGNWRPPYWQQESIISTRMDPQRVYSELLITANASLIVMLFTVPKLRFTIINCSNPVLGAVPLSNLYTED